MTNNTVAGTTWWLDSSAAPDCLNWARLQVFADGSVEVLDLDGKYHRFKTTEEAKLWLLEDEYFLAEHVIDEENLVGVVVPSAAYDKDLVPLMHVRKRG